MRAALLLCGQPRTMEFCYPSQKAHILDVYKPDVFIVSDEQEERLTELYNPVGIEIRSQAEIDKDAALLRSKYPPYDNAVTPPIQPNDMSCAWKVYRAAQLKREHEQQNGFTYDVVLRSRFDVKFNKVPPIGKAAENTLYIPRRGAYWITPKDVDGIHWHGYSSHLCWASSEVMDAIAGMYFEGEDNFKIAAAVADWGYIPEHVLKNFCDRNGIQAQFVDIDMMLIRGTSDAPLAYDSQALKGFPEYQ